MNKRAEWSSRDYFIAVLFFGGGLAIFSLMVASIAIDYDASNIVDEEFREKYDRVSEYTGKIENARESITEEGGLSILNLGEGIFKGSLAFIQLIMSSLGFIEEPVDNFINDFGLPYQIASIIFTIAIAIITVTLILRMLNSVTQGRL